jgi:diadenosine tetraphosphate (Ap4A) HIT family hydrolase
MNPEHEALELPMAPSWTDPDRWSALRDGSACPVCQEGPGDVIATLEASWVTLPPLTPLPGYICLVSQRHVVEPFELGVGERATFWEEVNQVAAALHEGLRPVKLNYEIHGNTLPHLHLHLYPRQRGDRFEGRPIDGRGSQPRTPAEVDAIHAALARLRTQETDP